MAYTLAYVLSRVPQIPQRAALAPPATRGASPDRHEHFGTEEAALRRVRELLPAASWIDLRLFGPDGRLIAGQHALEARVGASGQPEPP